MINKLKVFEIDPELKVIVNQSEVMEDFAAGVHGFFETHIYQSMTNNKTKDVRFRNDHNDMIRYCREALGEGEFSESSSEIASNLAINIHSNVTRNFHLMVAEYEVDNDEWFLHNGERVLAILKMETNNGVQMIDGEFEVRPDMLPDLGNQLQKCGFVIDSHIQNFEENNIGTGFHSKILDKQDSTISNYFMKLMESVVVADDGESTKMARNFIAKIGKKFVDNENKNEYTKQLDMIMSRRAHTNVNAIVTELGPYYEENQLESEGLTIDGLSDTIFEHMRQSNNSVKYDFVSEPFSPPKVSLRSNNSSVNITIEQALVDRNIVQINRDRQNQSINILIPEERIDSIKNLTL